MNSSISNHFPTDTTKCVPLLAWTISLVSVASNVQYRSRSQRRRTHSVIERFFAGDADSVKSGSPTGNRARRQATGSCKSGTAFEILLVLNCSRSGMCFCLLPRFRSSRKKVVYVMGRCRTCAPYQSCVLGFRVDQEIELLGVMR